MQIAANAPSPARPRPVRFSREDGAIELSPTAFRDSYVEVLAEQARVPTEPLRNLSLAVCHGVAVQLLGPIQAVALGGEALKALADPAALDDLDEGMRRRFEARPLGSTARGHEDLFLGREDLIGLGASTSRSVILPDGLQPLVGRPVGDFIVGHELGHVRRQDVLAGFGRAYLASKLGPQTQAEVRPILAELNHQAELSADREGIAYALERGHDRRQLQVGVATFFQNATDAEASDSHPARQERLDNLRQLLP